jgi:predicted NAD-dependent protein-ADP-ribosyltransferase YbiA (DUF1768 family)
MEINEIKMFNKEYAFLSNFYPAIIQFEGLNYATVEHAFVAAKNNRVLLQKIDRFSARRKSRTRQKTWPDNLNCARVGMI